MAEMICAEGFESYQDLIDTLSKAFLARYPDGTSGRLRMIGILFARPDSQLAKSSILPHLDYFHHRSGNNFDFFCAGYQIDPELGAKVGNKTGFILDGEQMTFSSRGFNVIREELEYKTTWEYSGGVDLILTNARYDTDGSEAVIDYSSAIVCKRDEMLALNTISSIERFFEDICRYSENSTGDDPTWEFSDHSAAKVSGSAFKRFVLSLLPKDLGTEVKRMMQFAVKDIAIVT